MTGYGLRHGYTTGACAAAAAKGAVLMLAGQALADEVTLVLPAGVSATFQLHGQSFTTGEAACHVIKDAGDDPDVTNGVKVHARVTMTPPPSTGGDIFITGGVGIGRVTKPGLAVPPGEWAINPVPRRMIEHAVREVFPGKALNVEISIPDGAERSKKTLNARLGIIGGLSILGTTGIVRPISAKAWTDTIDTALNVARACDSPSVVLSTGRGSELAAQKYLKTPTPLKEEGEGVGEAATYNSHGNLPPTPTLPLQGGEGGGGSFLPEEAFVMMGDHVAYALRACSERGFNQPVIACQFAKLLKIACGHENTHAAASELDLAVLLRWAEAEKLASGIITVIEKANTAREIILASGFDKTLLELVCRRAQAAANSKAPSLQVEFLVADYSGHIVFS